MRRTLLIILTYFRSYFNVLIAIPNFFLKNLKNFVFSIAKFFYYGIIESEIKGNHKIIFREVIL